MSAGSLLIAVTLHVIVLLGDADSACDPRQEQKSR